MCGIVGALTFGDNGFRLTESYVARMRDTMEHRGPDGAGVWVSPDRRVGLGHRRLSIIDLSTAASQPLWNEDNSVGVVFNGEIYNHAAIRAELLSIGTHRWRTDHSDTEVLLHAFEEWGIDFVHRLRGMFAIALWDGRSRELWLIRDRIGIKPLYYGVHHGRLTFASEIKALLEDPDQEREVDQEALYHYLSFLSTPAPMTLFAGIRKLPPGNWIRFRDDGSHRQQRYWDVWDRATRSELSENDIAERLLEELRTAVSLRKVSDVPVGVFLSGGIDSSTNAALFSEGESRPVRTFSIGYDGEYDSYKNELHYARMMAQRVGADHREVLLTERDLLDFLPRMIELQDEPIADPVCVPVYYLSKLARDSGVIVCQVGEGADELFWGYPYWQRMLQIQYGVSKVWPKTLCRIPQWVSAAAFDSTSLAPELFRRAAQGLPVFWSGAEAFSEIQKNALLSAHMRRRFGSISSWDVIRPLYDRFRQSAWEQTPLQWMSYADLSHRIPELLLMRMDKMSMGVSLEARLPFLDHRFVEFAMSIPEHVKTRNGTLKHILKKAVRGVIPDELIDRPKQGFGVPVFEWVFSGLGRACEREVISFVHETDFFDPRAVMGLLKEARSQERRRGMWSIGRARASHQVWYLLNLALWWRHYIAKQPLDLSAELAVPA